MRFPQSAVGVALLTVLAVGSNSAAAGEDVYVFGEYLTDSDGDNYGVEYFVSSTVNEQVCVCPYVVSQENVIGSIVTCETSNPVLLQPNESRVSIWPFISADQSKPWSINVAAKWQRCE